MKEGRKRAFDSQGNLLRKKDIPFTPNIKFSFIGGSRILDIILKFVPESNLEWLNTSSWRKYVSSIKNSSQHRFFQIKPYTADYYF